MVKNQPGDGETGKSQGLSTTWRRGVVLFSASALLLLMFSIDKLAVATQYSKSEFAEYAFAAGVLGIVYLALDALAYAINPFIGGELEMGSGDAHKLRWLFVMPDLARPGDLLAGCSRGWLRSIPSTSAVHQRFAR